MFSRCSCGAMSHKTKDCMERPRQKGAKWTNKHIAPDEKVEDIKLETYEARRDRWNGYEASEYSRIMDRYSEALRNAFGQLCFCLSCHCWSAVASLAGLMLGCVSVQV